MNVRARFVLRSITATKWRKEDTATKVLRFEAQYDDTIAEEARFAKATPTGHLEMQIDNPDALAAFELGKAYYLDMSPVAP